MLVVEFHLDSHILRTALERAPGTTVSHEDQYRTADGITLLFWAAGGDPAAFEDGLAADPTVTNVARLADARHRRLYRVLFTAEGEDVTTFPAWGELDLSLLDATATAEGWDLRMRMPDRDTLHRFREVCDENDVGFRLASVYEEREAATVSDARLTAVQREALLAAHELGYYDIPRGASLADVADHLDVSSQALSERLRRGTARLVETSLQDI